MFMKTISSYDAKTQFAALLKEVEAGESVIVTRHGKPVARMEAIHATPCNRQVGPLPPALRANCPIAEATAPVFEDIPWSGDDPV
jgi:antitoxin (DNA-binding transcriptional repressor) of toxin-antitoxin stability system